MSTGTPLRPPTPSTWTLVKDSPERDQRRRGGLVARGPLEACSGVLIVGAQAPLRHGLATRPPHGTNT